jgi:peroxiredoxin
MILTRLDTPPADFERRTGWTINDEGACRGDTCVPLERPFDVRALARRLGMALVHDEQHDLWALGPRAEGHALASAELPDLVLPDHRGRDFAMRSLRGSKVLMVAWASWCGCRSDLSGWRKLRDELAPHGLEIVSVALDTSGAEAASPWIAKAKTTHPALIDEAHLLDELLGVVNVPSGIWIDEDGVIVRPPEPAFPWRPRVPSDELLAKLPPLAVEQLREAQKIPIEPERYVAALRDWVAKGERSQFALSSDAVVARSQARDEAHSRAAACFELGQHLQRAGAPGDAVHWFREAQRSSPENWTYKRQAWSLADPLQGPTDAYDSDWLSEIREIGAERYYPKLEL